MEDIIKVKAGREYIFYPNLLDRVDGRTGLIPGDIVRVVNLPGCPRANTMGHAHVELNGKFVGLVHVNSLHSLSDAKLVADAIRRDMERIAARPHVYVGPGNACCNQCGHTLNNPIHEVVR